SAATARSSSSSRSRRRMVLSRLRASTSSPTRLTMASSRRTSTRTVTSAGSWASGAAPPAGAAGRRGGAGAGVGAGADAGTGAGAGAAAGWAPGTPPTPCRLSSRASKSRSSIESSSPAAAAGGGATGAAGAGAVPAAPARSASSSACGAGCGGAPAEMLASMSTSRSMPCWTPSNASGSSGALPSRAALSRSSTAWHTATMGSKSRKPAPPLMVWNPRNTAFRHSRSPGARSSATICSPSWSRISPTSTRKSAQMSEAGEDMALQPQRRQQAVGVVLAGRGRVQALDRRAVAVAGQLQRAVAGGRVVAQAFVDRAHQLDHAADDLAGEVLVALGRGHLRQPAADAGHSRGVRLGFGAGPGGEQARALLDQVQGVVAGVLADLDHVLQAQAGLGQRTAAAAGAERLLQFARELDQPLHQRLAAPMDQLVDIAAPCIVVLVLERCQRGVQAL